VQLVESYRNAEGLPRQRVVASLGAADIPEDEKSLIAGEVTRRLRGGDEEELAGLGPELSGSAAGWVARIVGLAGRSGGARQQFKSAKP